MSKGAKIFVLRLVLTILLALAAFWTGGLVERSHWIDEVTGRGYATYENGIITWDYPAQEWFNLKEDKDD